MFISVIICTYNRSESLRETLDSLNKQTVQSPLTAEILVVDNNSDDRTVQTVQDFQKVSRLPVSYLFESQQGLSYARNTGIRRAKGEALAFIDDDVLVEPGWLEGIWKCFSETGADVVAGKIEMLWVCEQPDWLAPTIRGPLISQDLGSERKLWPDVKRPMLGANMAFRRELFEKHGLFRVDLGRRGNLLIGGEDREIFERLVKAGRSIYYEPLAVVWHKVEEKRLSRDYMRRWFSDIGRTLGHQIDWKWHHRLSIVPFWVWQKLAASFLEFFRKNVSAQAKISERFASEVWLRYHAGILQERFFQWLPLGLGRRWSAFKKSQ